MAGTEIADLVRAAFDGMGGAEPEQDTRPGWAPLDLGDLLAALADGVDLTPQTGILLRDDGAGMLYPGKVHAVIGVPESLKTWLCFVAAVQTIGRGGRVAWLDLEDDAGTALSRLVALGVDLPVIRERFAYLAPEVPLLEPGGLRRDRWEPFAAWLEEWRPELIVVDSIGELSAMQGLSILDNNEMTMQSNMLKRVARVVGSTVLVIDHVAKGRADAAPTSIGAQAKGAAIDGAWQLVSAHGSTAAQ
jgi:hypothetical protein